MKNSEIIKTILLFIILILAFFLFLKNTFKDQDGPDENRAHNFTNNKYNFPDELLIWIINSVNGLTPIRHSASKSSKVRLSLLSSGPLVALTAQIQFHI